MSHRLEALKTLFVAPALGSAVDNGDGMLGLTWSNSSATEPVEYLALAWDICEEDWVRRAPNGSMWYTFPPTQLNGDMDLGFSGGYFVWVASQ